MKRIVYTIEDETTGETIAADTSLSTLEEDGALMVEFSDMVQDEHKEERHTFIIETHTLH